MSENSQLKCPYCGSGLLREEDGFRCRLCKSFFPFDTEQTGDSENADSLSELKPRIMSQEEYEEELEKAKEREEAEKKERFRKARIELPGLAASFFSAGVFMLCKTTKSPYLMIPGFILWAFSAGFTGFLYYKAKKEGNKIPLLRTVFMLVVAILVLIFVSPVE